MTPERAARIFDRLDVMHPNATTELNFRTPFELLVATILSAQCTDARVNAVTPALFEKYPDARAMAVPQPAELEPLIQPTGFFRMKSKSLSGMARALAERHNGDVPPSMDALVVLPGVGRKTANVVRSVAFDLPGLPVDTHVGRLSRRLKLTDETDPVKAELDLNELVAPGERGALSLRLILHGRKVCSARRPRCDECVLADICPSAFKVDGAPVARPRRRAM
jgi:endonuclease-3